MYINDDTYEAYLFFFSSSSDTSHNSSDTSEVVKIPICQNEYNKTAKHFNVFVIGTVSQRDRFTYLK